MRYPTQTPVAGGAGARQALSSGSVTASVSSCEMMDAMPSASALLLGLDLPSLPHWPMLAQAPLRLQCAVDPMKEYLQATSQSMWRTG